MKKPALILALLSVYIITAFAWWIYAHITNAKIITAQSMELLDLLPHRATNDLHEATEQGMFTDTIDMKKYLAFNYPQLTIQFMSEADPMYNYAIMAKQEAIAEIERNYKRKIWMYGLEGTVIAIILFWGILLIYRSLQNRVTLNKQQSNFLLSITHELKTPIASIKLYLETLLKRQNMDKEQTTLILQNSLSDITRLRDLVENLLTAAQLDSHKFNLSFQHTNFSDLVVQTVNKFSLPRNLQNRIKLRVEPELYANVDSIAFEMIITNLLSNAIKYSPVDKDVILELSAQASTIKLRVIDYGKGINEEDRKSLFQKFYRAEDENTRKSKGTGLGLFIVKTLVTLHQASITYTENTPNGSIFEISIQKHATQNIIS